MGLVDADDRVRQYVGVNSLVEWLQLSRCCLELVPERLGRNLEALALHTPHLALQRRMVEILRGRYFDGHVRRVTSARDQHRRTECCIDAGLAAAPILLTLDLPNEPGAFHTVDQLALLELTAPFFELAAARGADLVRLVQPVDLFHLFEGRLLSRAVARPRLRLRLLRRRRATLARLTESCPIRCGELPLQLHEFLLQLGRAQSLEPQQLSLQRHVLLKQPLVLALQDQRRLAQHLRILLVGEWRHVLLLARHGRHFHSETPLF